MLALDPLLLYFILKLFLFKFRSISLELRWVFLFILIISIAIIVLNLIANTSIISIFSWSILGISYTIFIYLEHTSLDWLAWFFSPYFFNYQWTWFCSNHHFLLNLYWRNRRGISLFTKWMFRPFLYRISRRMATSTVLFFYMDLIGWAWLL